MTAEASAPARSPGPWGRFRDRLFGGRRGDATRRDASPAAEPAATALAALERRVDHLESALEGLQDSVHRDSVRHDHQIHELVKSTQPEAVARALNDDVRRRGL